MRDMTWVRFTKDLKLPMSVGLLVKAVLAQMRIARHVSAIGYGMGTVPAADCNCTDLWRCRCDFPDHPFRAAPSDFWPDYPLLAFKVRGTASWLRLWLLDTGAGAVLVAEDTHPLPPTPRPITRACFMDWCDTCTGRIASTSGASDSCRCTHHTQRPS
ncbi:hypothetical protein [Catellatospora methionotrophica]|uniref:hypothetical protein n=1 Tax=Catellatospora methionotrophica TaxID=121620 RepID=UPI0034005DAB